MDEYKGVFSELRYEVGKVAFLNSFLNAALVFFIFNIIATFLQFSFWYSLVPAGLVFVLTMFFAMRQTTLRRIEEKNPEVKEILRTAHDNRKKDSLMVHALFSELLEKMETVTTGVFISAKGTLFKIMVICALSFAPLLIYNLAPGLIADDPLSNLGIGGAAQRARDALAPVMPIADAQDRDLAGQRDILDLGNERLDITTASSQGGVDFNNPNDAQSRQFKYNDYPEQVDAEQTNAGTGGTLTEGELINEYSCRVRGNCPPK